MAYQGAWEGYNEARAANDQSSMVALNQLNQVDAMQSKVRTRQALAQSGGDPEVAIKALINIGDVKGAQDLGQLVQSQILADQRRQQVAHRREFDTLFAPGAEIDDKALTRLALKMGVDGSPGASAILGLVQKREQDRTYKELMANLTKSQAPGPAPAAPDVQLSPSAAAAVERAPMEERAALITALKNDAAGRNVVVRADEPNINRVADTNAPLAPTGGAQGDRPPGLPPDEVIATLLASTDPRAVAQGKLYEQQRFQWLLTGKKQDFARTERVESQGFKRDERVASQQFKSSEAAKVAAAQLERQEMGYRKPVWDSATSSWMIPPGADGSPGRAIQPLGIDGKPVAKDLKLTEVQAKAVTFGMRARLSADVLEDIGKHGEVQRGTLKRIAEAMPFIGDGLGTVLNWTQSEAQQQVEQAERDFMNAVLRQESGAAIGVNEFDNGRKQYFPQPGDKPEQLEQKRRNREAAIRGFEITAGAGAPAMREAAQVLRNTPAGATPVYPSVQGGSPTQAPQTPPAAPTQAAGPSTRVESLLQADPNQYPVGATARGTGADAGKTYVIEAMPGGGKKWSVQR